MAARAIWKGVITLGRLKVPVKLYSAVEDRGVHFTLLHDQEMQPVRQKMIDTTTGKPVESEQTQKGVEVEPGRFVILHPEELTQLEPEASRDILIEQFIDDRLLTHEWYERPYYLGPDGDDESYFALAAALADSGKEGLARWVMRKREYLGSLRAERGYLMLITLRHADEVIGDSLEAPGGRKIDAKELRMAEQLVSALEDEFKPEDYQDEYRARVMELIESKAKGKKITLAKPVEKKATTQSLEDVLKASIAAARERGGVHSTALTDSAEPREEHDDATPRRPHARREAKKTTKRRAPSGGKSRKERRRG